MSDDKTCSTDPDLEPDAPLDQIEPGKDGQLVAMRGYLGDDPETRDVVRLYATLNFDSFWAIPRKAIKHRERLESRTGSTPGSLVWVEQNTEIEFCEVRSQTVRADFLRGSINPAGPAAVGDFSAGNIQRTGWICVTATIVVTTTIITSRSDSTNSNCCPSDACSASSQCLCSGGGQTGPSCQLC